MKEFVVGVVGAGAMGSGIAQVAAQSGHKVHLFDTNEASLVKSKAALEKVLNRLIEKGKIKEERKNEIQGNIAYESDLNSFKDTNIVIEAIIENIDIKKKVFSTLEGIVSSDCILASNTSSLSIASREPEAIKYWSLVHSHLCQTKGSPSSLLFPPVRYNISQDISSFEQDAGASNVI